MIQLLFFAIACCGLPDRPPESDEFPFQVMVKDLRKGSSLCSGVLIAPDVVLSPASCVHPDGHVKVSAGSIFASKQNETRTYSDVIIRSGYNGTENNIAIIKVSNKFPVTRFIRAAKVPVYGTGLIKSGELSGWITLDLDDSLKVIGNYSVLKDCKSRFNIKGQQSPDSFCGEYTPGLQSGGLFTMDGVIYGLLMSTSASKNMQQFVEVSMHAKWIKDQLPNTTLFWHKQGPNRAASVSCFGTFALPAALLLYNGT